jgi:hypothetical protein
MLICSKKQFFSVVFSIVFVFSASYRLNAQEFGGEIHEKILGQFGVDTLIMLEGHFENIQLANQKQADVDEILVKIEKLKEAEKARSNKISALTIKALQEMIAITRIYEESFEVIFALYSARLMEYPIVDFEKFTKANELLVEAMEMNEQMKGNLSDLTFNDSDSIIFTVIKESNAARFNTLFKFQEAFCVYLECGKKEELIVSSDTLHIEPVMDLNILTTEIAEIDTTKKSWEWLKEPVDTTEWDYFEVRNDFIVFRVQIFAVRTALDKERLNDLYSGYADVYVNKEDDFYQYWVGSFFTYNEALKFCNLYGKNAFVIAIKGGRRISIRQAIEETSIENISSTENEP